MTIAKAPDGFATVNPFIITRDALGLIDFVTQVFSATERPEAKTIDHDGLLLHAEVSLGDTTVMFGERKPDWPFTPSLLQVYVDDIDTTLDIARRLRATVVTEPTDFYGEVFSRFRDPWNNLWWVYRHGAVAGDGDQDQDTDWGSADGAPSDDEEGDWAQASSELTYIHDTLVTAMRQLRED